MAIMERQRALRLNETSILRQLITPQLRDEVDGGSNSQANFPLVYQL